MLSALPNDVVSKIQCGQLHSELFEHRHSTLQSHGLFALAKRLLIVLAVCIYRLGIQTSLFSWYFLTVKRLLCSGPPLTRCMARVTSQRKWPTLE